MRNILKRGLIVLTIASILATGAWAADDAGAMIPADSYVAVVVKSPKKMLSSVDAFLKAAKLDSYFPEGTTSLAESLLKADNEEYSAVLKEIDLTKPLVVAIVPGPDKTMGLQAWIPVLRGKASVDAMLPDSSDDVKYAIVGTYAVLVKGVDAPKALPAKRADAPWLALQPDDALAFWVNWEKGRADFGDGFFLKLGSIGSSYSEEKRWYDEKGWFPATGSDEKAEDEALSALKALAAEIRSFGGMARADADGVSWQFACATTQKGTLHDVTSAFSTLKPGIPFSKYAEGGKLVSVVWNYPPEVAKIVQKLYAQAFASLGESFIAYFNKVGEMNAFIGSNAAMSFDFSIDPKFMAEAGNAQTAPAQRALLDKYLRINLASVFELKDTQGYRKQLAPWMKELLSGELMTGLMAQVGMTFKPALEVSTVDGYPVDSIRLNLGMDPSRLESMDKDGRDTVVMILDFFNEKLGIRYAYRDGRAYGGFMTAKEAAAYAGKDVAVKRMDSARSYVAFAKTLPSDARLLASISFGRIASIMTAVAPQFVSGIDVNALGDAYFFGGVSRDAFSAGMWLSASDIGTASGLVMTLIGGGK
ncbi:MAG: hypothetical protein NT080_02095 [Spirochaetes bacterium]|nr:hypothetical protein [Spirochaetota bacterium]